MEEYFDVVDKNRKPLNKKLLRGSKLNENEYNTGVEIWIFNSNNELLLTQRSLNKSHPLQWECPGGCVIAGENSNQTIVREIKEEIGYNLNNEFNLLATYLYKYQFIDIYTTKLDININELRLQEEEISDAKFVSFEEFKEMNFDNKLIPSLMARYEFIKDKILNFN